MTEAEKRALELERCWALIAPDEADINGPSAPDEYRREIDRIIEDPEAEKFAPVIVSRLRRRRGGGGLRSTIPTGGMAAAVMSGASAFVPQMIEKLAHLQGLGI